MKILIVDDNQDILKMLARKLRKTDWEIHMAKNGEEAIAKAFELEPDLTLMDMHMPTMDGHTATRKLREKNYQGIIVALTASVMEHEVEKAIQSGCNGFIAKPVQRDFAEQLQSYLPKENEKQKNY